MVLYPGRDSIHKHRIRGEKEQCKKEFYEIILQSMRGNYCRFIGEVVKRKEELTNLEDVENINFLYNVAEWMVEKLEYDGERSMLQLAKQIKKIEVRLKSIIGLFKQYPNMPHEFLNLIELCDQVVEGYVTSIFEG